MTNTKNLSTNDIAVREHGKTLRAELLAQTKRELAVSRSALDGAEPYERGQLHAEIRRLEDELAALQPR